MWHRRLSDKFKNSRKRIDRCHPEVVKRKRSRLTTTSLPTGKQNKFERDPADDDTSIETFIKEMKMTKKKDPEFYKIRMERTFADRRKSILDGNNIAELKEEYPLLFTETEVN